MENPKQKEDEANAKRDDESPDRQSVERMMNLRKGSNALNSSSLLANVLDINDNFVGNGPRTIYVNKQAQRRIMAKRLNEQQNTMALENYDNGSQKFKKGFKREESNLSDSEALVFYYTSLLIFMDFKYLF